MIDLFFWTIIFLISLFLLLKGSDYFIDYAKEISTSLGISPFIIGITIVSLGTSLPELLTSIFSVINNKSEMVIGNVIGSNIANVFLIGGVAAFFGKNLYSKRNLISVDLPYFLGSALFLYLVLQDGTFSILESLLFILSLIVYLFYSSKNKQDKKKKFKNISLKSILGFLISSLIIYFSANFLVKSVINVSEIMSISTGIIAVSVIAFGTSLPELFVSVSAAKKGEADLVFGNIIGSNIFNIFGVIGISRLFGNIVVSSQLLFLIIPIFIISTIVFFIMTQENRLTSMEGILLIIFYLYFLTILF